MFRLPRLWLMVQVSLISRKSIDLVKEFYRDELAKEDWMLMVKLKKLLGVE